MRLYFVLVRERDNPAKLSFIGDDARSKLDDIEETKERSDADRPVQRNWIYYTVADRILKELISFRDTMFQVKCSLDCPYAAADNKRLDRIAR